MARPVVRLSLTLLLALVQASAQQITVTGLTGTTVSISNKITTVTTTTVTNAIAFNSFGLFNVFSGNTVRLVVPKGTTNLVNVIANNIPNFNGLLTCSNEEAGVSSHVYFVNPNGYIIGNNGLVDMDSVTMAVPTTSWAADFFTASNQPNPSAVNALLDGTAPLHPMGYLIHSGSVRAKGMLCLRGHVVTSRGALVAGVGEGAGPKDGNIRIEALKEARFFDGAKLIANRGSISVLCSTNLTLYRALLAASSDVLLQASVQDIAIASSRLHAGENVRLKAGGQTIVSADSSIVSQPLEGGAPYLTIRLVTGWNLLSYNSALASPVTNVLAGIVGKYSMVCTLAGTDWKFHDQTNTAASTLTTFEPGVGYWINATEAATLDLP